MRMALISDTHGNAYALRTVLEDIERVGVDQIVFLGDAATLGPEPAATIEMLQALSCPCVLGNHDAFVCEPELIHQYTKSPPVVASVAWCREQLSDSHIAFLKTFEPTIELTWGHARVLLFHGTPRSHTENLLATTPPKHVDDMLDGHHADVMAGGHTHLQMLRQHRGALLVNPGSVGSPLEAFVDGGVPTLLPHAEYAIIEIDQNSLAVTLRRVPIDTAELCRIIQASDIPMRDWLLSQYTS